MKKSFESLKYCCGDVSAINVNINEFVQQQKPAWGFGWCFCQVIWWQNIFNFELV